MGERGAAGCSSIEGIAVTSDQTGLILSRSLGTFNDSASSLCGNRPGMKPILISGFLIFFSVGAHAQQSALPSSPDTAAGEKLASFSDDLPLLKPLFQLPPDFGEPLLYNDSARVLPGAVFIPLSQRFGLGVALDPHPLSTLRLHWKSDEKLQLFQSVLVGAEGAGTAYILYRHLKKRGILK